MIPVKNEKDHIVRILTEVTHQTYPKESYEIIIVDDQSTDITPNVCRSFAKEHPNLTLLSTKENSSPLRFKKRPLDMGIRHASGEIILLTDADCHVSSSWIEVMASYFTTQVGAVVGYAQVSPSVSSFERIQALDFLLLMAAAEGTTQMGIPLACTGQNLAYRKEAFEEVKGFSSFPHAVGGDDNLLLQRIKHQTDWKIAFASDSFSYVSSAPLPTLRDFVTQRMRWASDSSYVRQYDPFFFSIIIITFVVNLLPLTMLAASLWTPALLIPLAKGLAAKFAVEGVLMMKATRVLNRRELRKTFAGWFLLQIPYVVAMGILSFGGHRLQWGGREK
ncbi:MAG: glycosyltransferase [Candidatus Neomarinimicrobiota bacterium]